MLGDFCDTTAFRGGARGTPDESAPIRPDIADGLEFIKSIKASLVLCGNHEARLWRLAGHHSAIIAELARNIVQEIEATCRRLRAELVPYHVINGWREIGGVKYLHGYWYNINASRDAAESYGRCVHGHTHTTGLAKGRRIDNPTGMSVGCLCRIPNMDYAMARRQSLAWAQGFVWGEYTDNDSMLWLHENGQNLEKKPWRLPV